MLIAAGVPRQFIQPCAQSVKCGGGHAHSGTGGFQPFQTGIRQRHHSGGVRQDLRQEAPRQAVNKRRRDAVQLARVLGIGAA
ncbi:MAG TPA: hypothetical protein VF916_03155, partial [Ktedonobacterales bacterium]